MPPRRFLKLRGSAAAVQQILLTPRTLDRRTPPFARHRVAIGGSRDVAHLGTMRGLTIVRVARDHAVVIE